MIFKKMPKYGRENTTRYTSEDDTDGNFGKRRHRTKVSDDESASNRAVRSRGNRKFTDSEDEEVVNKGEWNDYEESRRGDRSHRSKATNKNIKNSSGRRPLSDSEGEPVPKPKNKKPLFSSDSEGGAASKPKGRASKQTFVSSEDERSKRSVAKKVTKRPTFTDSSDEEPAPKAKSKKPAFTDDSEDESYKKKNNKPTAQVAKGKAPVRKPKFTSDDSDVNTDAVRRNINASSKVAMKNKETGKIHSVSVTASNTELLEEFKSFKKEMYSKLADNAETIDKLTRLVKEMLSMTRDIHEEYTAPKEYPDDDTPTEKNNETARSKSASDEESDKHDGDSSVHVNGTMSD